ncbi:MAG: carboxypeptidase regulatory-like domain-containing protein [Solirubrobacteraceae bacterium]
MFTGTCPHTAAARPPRPPRRRLHRPSPRSGLAAFLMPLLASIAIALLAPAAALAANGSVTGTVSDATTTNPVQGITVSVETPGGTVIASATTLANGTYNVVAVPPGTYVAQFDPGSAAGYLTQWYSDETTLGAATSFTVASATPTPNISAALVENPGQISGTVTDATTNAGLGGIDVRVETTGGDEIADVPTNPNGTYTVPDLFAGTYVVQFNPGSDDDYGTLYYNGSATFSGATPVTVGGGANTPGINGALHQISGHITGTVTDASTNAPLSGVSVSVYDSFGDPVGNGVSTGADGTYTVTGLQTGSYRLEFSAEGQNYITQYYSGKASLSEATPIPVSTGATTAGINAALAIGGKITGTVTAAAGNVPLPGTEVSVYDISGGGRDNVASAMAGAGGVYTAQGLASGLYVVEFFDTGPGANYLPQYYNGQPVTGDNPTLVAVTAGGLTSGINGALATAGAISGTVTNQSTGQPLANVSVQAFDSAGDDVGDANTAADGTYTITGLTTGTYRILFSPSDSGEVLEYYGGAASLQAATGVSVTTGTTTPNINQALLPASQGGTISGTVTSAGQPLAGVTVTIYDSAGNPVSVGEFQQFLTSATTASDGTYQSAPLLPGTYKVEFSTGVNLAFQYYNGQATLAGATPVGVSAGANTPNVNAVLSAGATMSGTVTDAVSHAGLSGVEVDLLDASGNVLDLASTNEDGTYTMVGIPAGTYHVEFVPFGSTLLPGGAPYATQYYNDRVTLGSSDTVAIATGASIGSINAALISEGSQTTPVTTVSTTTTTTITLAAPKPGAPTLTAGVLTGIGKRKVTLKFVLKSGVNSAPLIKSFKIGLPKGLSFIAKHLRKHLKVSGGRGFGFKLAHGDIVVTLKTDAAKVSVTISSAAISVTKKLAKEAKKGKLASLAVGVSITDVAGRTTATKLVVSKPH